MKKIVVLILLIIIAWNCQSQKVALGDSGMLHVFADSTHWDIWKEAVEQVFGKTKEMPYPEPEFRINFHHADEFPLYKNRKNLLILGYLDGKDNASILANKMLTVELRQGVKDGKYFYFQKENLWANGQFLLIGVGRDKTDVFSQLMGNRKQMVAALRNHFYAKLQESMFSRGEQEDLEQEILKAHDFGIRMQVDYQVVLDKKKDNFFLIRRYRPDRFLFVHYLENKTADFITSQNIIAVRDSLGKKHLKGDYAASKYTRFFPVNFNGFKALKIEGVWQNKERFIGGPFRTYAFFDSVTNRVYMVDFHVYKPDGLKKAYIDQLEIIANSFRLKHEIKNFDDPWGMVNDD
ncbi:MAG: DUF4837 family protein [Calditrichia bacterium]|nr:DUF4837 family protein [Calditrichia bacterium]